MILGHSRSGCKRDLHDGRVGVLEFRACSKVVEIWMVLLHEFILALAQSYIWCRNG